MKPKAGNMDSLGARASNAGDAFHEIWAMRKALELLDPESRLVCLTVEGIPVANPSENNRSWDGVDCALFYGESKEGPFDRIEIVQLKYSPTAPEKMWALGRLKRNTKQEGNNSVARRLADAFNGIIKECGLNYEDARKTVTVSLVTNQSIAPSLVDIVKRIRGGKMDSGHAEKLREATGLPKTKLRLFCECLDLKGGERSRAELETDVTRKIGQMIDTDARDASSRILMEVTRRMLPEGRGERITRITVESWFGVGRSSGLFPCEARLETAENLIERSVASDLAEAVRNRKNRLVCFHGGGGHGKSSVAQGLETLLPPGSKVVLYDCYGAGSYRDPSRYRHRPRKAFTQLSNELARKTRAPFLVPVPQRDNTDFIESFRIRLEQASELIETGKTGALLVILIDAADNAVAASQIPTPADECFVHGLVRMSELPDNVRIVISTRTSRKNSLNLPPECEEVPCPPFSPEETGRFLARRFADLPSNLVEDFHHLSGGNPRVQSSALAGRDSFEEALEFLRPHGKSLEDIYRKQMNEAFLRAGGEDAFQELFCAAVSIMPFPIPARLLGTVCDTDKGRIEEICGELVPNLRVAGRGVELANEDFENFCEKRGANRTDESRQRIADTLHDNRFDSEYAAIHLFDALLAAGRNEEIFNLLDEEDSTRVIKDPVVRGLTDLARLRISMSVVSRYNDDVEAVKRILVGSEAIETDWKTNETLIGNLDLSARFSRDAIYEFVLGDPRQLQLQGPALAYLVREYALEGKAPASREALHRVQEWSRSGNEYDRATEIGIFVAITVGHYKNEGWEAAENFCKFYRNPFSAFLKRELVKFIAFSEDIEKIREIQGKISRQQRWIAGVFIKRCGGNLSAEELRDAAMALADFDFDCLDIDDSEEFDKSENLLLIDDLLFFAELCKKRGTGDKIVAKLVEKILPRAKRKIEDATLTRPYLIDFCFRAESLETLGKKLEVKNVFQFPESQTGIDRDSGAKQPPSFERNIRDAELLLPFYNALATAYADGKNKDLDGSIGSLLKEAEIIFSGVQHWYFLRLVEMIGRRVFDLQIMNGMNIDQTLDILGKTTPRGWPFDRLQFALRNGEFFDKVVNLLDDYVRSLENYNWLATEKAEELTRISRLLFPVNEDESRAYFKKALNLVKAIDYELIDQLNCLLEMAGRFSRDTPQNRKRGEGLARLVRRAGMLLGDEKSFPYPNSMTTITSLSTPVSACILNRWADEGFVETDMCVKFFLLEALGRKTLPVFHVAALSLLAGNHSTLLTDSICESAKELPESVRDKILTEVAGRELTNLAPDAPKEMSGQLERLAASLGKPNATFRNLADAHAFLKSNSLAEKPATDIYPLPGTSVENKQKPDWPGVDILDPDSMSATMETNRAAGYRDEKTYYSDLAARVEPSDRIGHLDALARIAKSKPYPANKVMHIANCLRKWKGESVKGWAGETLPGLIVELSSTIMIYGGDPFESLVKASGVADEKLKDTIVAAVEKNAREANLTGLLKYAAALVNALPEEQAGKVFDWYVSRLDDRVKVRETSEKRHDLPVDDLPDVPDEIAAAFLYRFLGDMDVRLRWRAAHSVRAFVRLGEEGVVPALVRHALSAESRTYTFGDMPFHELTARLFLAITLARIAFESPETIAAADNDVLRLATEDPPHIMIEHYVKRALTQADKAAGTPRVSARQIERLARPVKGYSKPPEKRSQGGFRSRTIRKNVRFNFGLLDTLPYWYEPAVKIFADVSAEEFLKRADFWIVDRWNGNETGGDPHRDPRHNRLGLPTSRHGATYPDVESRARYLEWHAMCVVVGELLRTRKLAKTEDRNPFKEWMENWDTAYEGAWVCDLLRPIPPEPRYWVRPSENDPDWLNPAGEETLFNELFAESRGWPVISSYRATEKYSFGRREAGQLVKVDSSLVPPETAPALARAFRAADYPYPWDVELPGNSLDNNSRVEGFTARRTVIDRSRTGYSDGGLDSSDPASGNAVTGVSLEPAEILVESLRLSQTSPWSGIWSSGKSDREVCRYDSWSTQRNDGYDSRGISRDDTAVYGKRLAIDAEALARVLEKLGNDLLVVVRTKNFRGDIYVRINEEDGEEVHSVGAYVLRQDGTVEDANGKTAGTWLPDSQGHRG